VLDDLQILTKSEWGHTHAHTHTHTHTLRTQLDTVVLFALKLLKQFSFFLFFFNARLFLNPRAPLSSPVLRAMRDDSEKVPALLTDYILKGKRLSRLQPLGV